MPANCQILGRDKGPKQLMGHVRNNYTKQPIKNAKVMLLTADSVVVDSTMSTITDYEGSPGGFNLKVKKAGNYIIKCQHPDYETSYTPLNIKFYKYESLVSKEILCNTI